MSNCNFDGCYGGPYYPRRINTCSCLNTCSVGQIVNPQVQGEWGVFLLTDETVISSGEINITLEQDGMPISGTESVVTGDEGEVVNLSNKIILNFEDATQLTLVNSSSDAVAVELANLTILKL